jgi:cytochrome P450
MLKGAMLVASSCPFDPARDDRKTAHVAAARAQPEKGTKLVGSFAFVREALRSPAMKQGGGGAEHFDTSEPDKAPVFYLEGAPHKKKRATIARFFTPKIITTRYRDIIERVIAEQFAELRRTGRGQLDLMSFDLAVAVAADIVGLNNSDRTKMAHRLSISLAAAWVHKYNFFGRVYMSSMKALNAIDFFYRDVKPAIRARRANPQDDILSHLLKEGYRDKAILMECMTYAAAGMVTTREFIVVAAWHMFDNPALKTRFLSAEEPDQFAILLEVLRLEPIAHFLYRRTEDPDVELAAQPVEPGTNYALNLREANFDEIAVGPCPFALDPDRATQLKTNGAFLSFGDGAHHCPGWQVALHETRLFLDALMRVPGIHLERAPDVGWVDLLQSYELRNAIVTCDPAKI